MSAEHFFDDLARTLAEPMPRRRAVRVIGASLVAVAVPGISPRPARAAARVRSQEGCSPGILCCQSSKNGGPTFISDRCPYPGVLWACDGPDDDQKCVRRCTGNTTATWSSAKDAAGNPTRFDCCPRPQTEPSDGLCVPSCALFGPGAFKCKQTCCPQHTRCQAGRCVGACSPDYDTCGRTRCCPQNWNCCPNPDHCCAPTESCCGDDCCPRGKFCCDGGGNATDCCSAGERCLFKRRAGPKGGSLGLPQAVRCVPKCKPSDWCGPRLCCGDGFRCVRKRNTFKCVLGP